MTHRFALHTHGRGFRAKITIGIDFHFNAAVAEDAFSHHCDHIDAIDLGRHDERCRLVVWISGTGTNGRDENTRLMNDLSIPVATSLKRNETTAMRYRALKYDMRIDADQLAIIICITVACTRSARLDVAHNRTCIAADLVRAAGRCNRGHFSRHDQNPREPN